MRELTAPPNTSLQRTAPVSAHAQQLRSVAAQQHAVRHAACGARVAPPGLVVPAVGCRR